MKLLFFFILVLPAAAQDTTRLSLMFIGDIMQHDSQLQSAYNRSSGRYEYDTCFHFISRYFRMADMTVGNLELTLGGKPYRGYPQFSAPDELAVALKNAGIDVLVTANNHSLDRRRKGLERTIRVLDSLNILHTGTFRDTVERLNDYPLLLQANGITVALLNYTYGTNGIPVTRPNVVNLIDTAVISRDLKEARQRSPDAIIVFMHWGSEYQTQPTAQQKELASFCFSRGASIVVGAHPHVLQPVYLMDGQNRLVAYSLGNFISGQRDHPRDGAASLWVDLMKVYTSDSSYTRISDARYLLHWVYRSPLPNRRYVILPVPDFESDTVFFRTDPVAKEAFQKFIVFARRLLNAGKHGPPEMLTPAPDPVVRYKVTWRMPAGNDSTLLLPDDFRFGLIQHADDDHHVRCETGNFRTLREAALFAERLKRRFKEVEIIRVKL
ncbi:MAG: capsular polysaccharide biosynthesis protein [Cyclobacteriaceae bacterium]|nr:MAG: capsular polysaccharide biosynthesis protein [Cyclobacteriaceae bacterium]